MYSRSIAVPAILCLTPLLSALPGPGDTVRASLTTSGGECNERSDVPVISADGRYVAFQSSATDLVPGDSNFSKDIFVRDLWAGTTTRVSVTSGGAQGNHHSEDPTISADGRYVAFTSQASNLVAGDSNGFRDIFLHDRNTGTTTRASVGMGGAQSAGHSEFPSLTPDGRYLAFSCGAANLVPGDTNGAYDCFVRDLLTGTNTRISVSSAGVEGDANSWSPVLSEDGLTIAFDSLATNLISGDANGAKDVFVRDLALGTTERISESTAGTPGNSYSQEAAISGDGRYVTFESRATTLVPGDSNGVDDIFWHDRLTGETRMVSVHSSGAYGNFWSNRPSISADGARVAFQSWSSNLVPGDTNSDIDIYVYEVATRTTQRVSVDSNGSECDNHCAEAAISNDGAFIAFRSDATDLVLNDTNGKGDVFVHEYTPEVILGVPFCSGDGSGADCPCFNPGATDSGCANSTALGASLDAGGSTSVLADDLSFSAGQLPASQPILLFSGTTTIALGDGLAFGDGLRCVGGTVIRHSIVAANASGAAAWASVPAGLGGWTPGDTRYFQGWYRDPVGPCGSGYNLTNGVRVIFTP